MTVESEHIVVIGAGPAGATLAAALARANKRVLLLERDAFPRDKLCGEFLSGEAESWLSQTGAHESLLAHDPPAIRRAAFVAPTGRRADLVLETPGIGISRKVLDETLYTHAIQSGAEGRTRVEVEDVRRQGDRFLVTARDRDKQTELSILADLVIGAHGRRARIDNNLNRSFTKRRHPFVGLKRHHREVGPSDLSGAVEIHTFEGGYCGMSHVEGGVVNVCMLLEERFVDELGGAHWDVVIEAIRRKSPSLNERLRQLSPVDVPCAVAQIPFEDKGRHHDGVLFVGDASQMIAPLAGDGQAMALESAVLLAELIQTEDPVRLCEQWDRRWREIFTVRVRLAAALQRGLLHSTVSPWMVRGVGAIPPLGSALLRLLR